MDRAVGLAITSSILLNLGGIVPSRSRVLFYSWTAPPPLTVRSHPWPEDALGPGAKGDGGGTSGRAPGPEDQGPPVLGPVGGPHLRSLRAPPAAAYYAAAVLGTYGGQGRRALGPEAWFQRPGGAY